jgi:ferredoxin
VAGGGLVKVHADRDVCCGSGMCALRLPEVFDQDEREGTVVVLDATPPPELARELAAAAHACPSGAIRVEP